MSSKTINLTITNSAAITLNTGTTTPPATSEAWSTDGNFVQPVQGTAINWSAGLEVALQQDFLTSTDAQIPLAGSWGNLWSVSIGWDAQGIPFCKLRKGGGQGLAVQSDYVQSSSQSEYVIKLRSPTAADTSVFVIGFAAPVPMTDANDQVPEVATAHA